MVEVSGLGGVGLLEFGEWGVGLDEAPRIMGREVVEVPSLGGGGG